MTCLPEYIQTQRHDDWLWPMSYIPRRWTSWCWPLPMKKLMGNQEPIWTEVQPDYQLVPEGEVQYKMENGRKYCLTVGPVPRPGQWSLQGCWSNTLRRWIPCYFAGSKMLFGRRLHFNIGAKPDLTWNSQDPVPTKNWHVGFPETSLTFTKYKV